MITTTTFKSAIAATTLTLALAAQAHAETSFDTLAGIEAEVMNAQEMEAVQGKNVFTPPLNDPLNAFGNGIAVAAGVTPEMINAFFPGFHEVIGDAFSQGGTMYDGINTINALIAGIGGTPFVPVGSPLPPNFPAASSGSLNTLLGLAGQPTLPMVPGFRGF